MASVLQVATIKDQGGNNNAIEIANSSANVTINNLAGGTIGSGVTIADGANPHGWEHIKTIAYSANTATPISMTNVVSSAYSAYKLVMQIGTTSTSAPELYFRYLDSSGNELTASGAYQYGGHTIAENGTEGTVFSGSSNWAQIGRDVYWGNRGWNGEILFSGCYASSTDYPQIDGYQLDASREAPTAPHGRYMYTGHDYGSYDHGVYGFFWYSEDPTYVTGWRLYFSSSALFQKGSWWSCYGLKLPTAD